MRAGELILTFCLIHLRFSADSFHLEALSRSRYFLDFRRAGGDLSPSERGPGTIDGAASLSGCAPSLSLFTHQRAHTHSQRSTMQHNRTVTIQSWPKTDGCSNGVLEEHLIRG